MPDELWYKMFPDAKAMDELVRVFELHEIRKKMEALQPDSTLIMDPNDPQWKEYYIKYGIEFKELVLGAVQKLIQPLHQGKFIEKLYKDLKIEFRTDVTILLRDLHPKLTDIPVTFQCTIISVDARKTFVKQAVFACPICKDEVVVKCSKERQIEPQKTKCNRKSCRRTQLMLDSTRMTTDYIQTVIVQELLEEARNNSPVSFVAKLIGNQVGEAFISQKKKITGVFKSYVDPRKIEQDIYIDIIELEGLEDKEILTPTNEQIEQYKKDCRVNGWMDKLIESYAPHIYGYHDIKHSILLLLAGGVKTHKRADINIFLVGDPSMAKTELLKFGEKVTQKSAYTTGKGSSGVGLTIAIIKEENLGRYMATAGVYPLCNGGYVFVDEFDKMNKEDRSAMHEVLEHGMCSVAKAGIKLSLPAKVATLAAANPQYGSYDSELTVADNVNLPSTILSRFDMIWLIKDKVNEFDDEKKARHVLKEFSGEDSYKAAFLPKELMSILNYIKQLKPVLCDDANELLLTMYKKMRKASEKQDSIPVGVRQLEALVRLSMAHAKWNFKDVVEVEDIEAVINLYKASFLSYGVNLEDGTIGNALMSDFTSLNKDQFFWHTWHKIAVDGKVDKITFLHALQGTKQFNLDVDALRAWDDREHKQNVIGACRDGTYEKKI